jgi:hypothetical protein
LQTEGIDVEIPVVLHKNAAALDIHAPEMESHVCDLGTNGAAYFIKVRAVSLCRLTITHCEICTKWDNDALLQSFVADQEPVCNFGGFNHAWSEVLNDRIERGLHFSCRGKIVEGWILFRSTLQIPAKHRNGAIVPVELTLVDEFGESISQIVQVQVLRAAKRNVTPRPRQRLFEVLEDQYSMDATHIKAGDMAGPVSHKKL